MPYRIEFDSPFDEEVRRIGSELIADASMLLEKQPDGPHEAIHDARKDIKRLRALYRLVRSAAPEVAAAENGRLRDIAHSLAHFRDQAALVETTDYLEGRTDGKDAKSAVRRLGRTMRHRRDAAEGIEADMHSALSSAVRSLDEADAELAHFDLPGRRKQAIGCISTGWRKTGKRARAALDACRQTEEDEPFHELRKRAQDRYMHAALLRAAWPSGMISIQRHAKALVDLLGHEHDLAVLAGRVEAGAGLPDTARDQILGAILAERRKLQAAAKDMGAEVFDEHPKRDAEIVELLVRCES